ncbi:hypothetical protein [Parapedobacter sp. 10938]|uniref:hypothetical protein n=1 Tax=Parapedobacter flavus TaxID=3110225 RepID=UPI002DB9424C|nr:hypothetical protein [Parapedobacter sp. 10938]MEC3882039.1 hypothetical protein [Parapedobacter sp. 10938]
MNPLTAIASYWKRIPQLIGVEVLVGDGDALTINIAWVKRSWSNVQFVRGEYGLLGLGALADQVGRDVPVAISISGKGIIHRKLPANGAGADSLKAVLPNTREEDFYVQQVDWEGASWLSVARRELVDKIVEQVTQQGVAVVRVALGPLATLLFADYLGVEACDAFVLGRQPVDVQQDGPPGKPVDLGGEQLNEKLVPAFALAFATIGEVAWPQLPIGAVLTRWADYRVRWAFRRSATVLMVFFLSVLLGNAFYFMHYADKVSTLDGSDGLAIQREMERLEQETAARDELLRGLWDADKPAWGMAYLADRIAASRPEGIRFVELEIYPRDEEASRKQRRPVHTELTIRIDGTCADMQVLNAWMEQLRVLLFCERVAIHSYGYEERNAEGVFRLALTLKP